MAASSVMLSAITPTNKLTLGNYLGALKNWVELQHQYQCYFFAVDLHSITVRQDPKALLENTYFAVATYLAAGLDPKNCTLFIQSHVPEHAELAWVLNCFTSMGELNRMTQFKDKSAQAGKNIPAGLFSYPVLMASDILLYQANLIPVGADQKQHIELTRNLAERLNHLYGEDLFTVPEPFIPKVGAKILSLQDPTKKMSKSDPNPKGHLYLSDSPKQMEKKIKGAVTDSESEIRFDLEKKPGLSNLISIQSSILGKSVQEITQSYQGKQYGELKVDTAEIVVQALQPLQEKTKTFLADRTELDSVLKKGAQKAREVASQTLQKVYQRVGLIPR